MSKLTPGDKAPELVNIMIEVPLDSRVKYELDHDLDAIVVDRFLFFDKGYPANYGFIPNTLSGDGDPVDVLVLSPLPVVPGVVMVAKPIGMLETEDEKGMDAKLVAVPPEKVNPEFGKYNDITELPAEITDKIKYFFENYKKNEPGKWVKVSGWKGREDALEEIRIGIKNFKS
ncbi:MAG TPA: inorganic diphosphatase [Patescibacteria group bacterium]|nr:inorganic diphosphatase [Patescibacteria group bacterium]